MKTIFYLLILIIGINTTVRCTDNVPVNDCFRGIEINAIIDLTLPEFQGLLVPNGSSQNTIQGRDIYIFRTGNSYKAFDRQCPDRNCNSLMTFNGVEIICPCDEKKYNYISGGSPIDTQGCNALMYFVTKINGSQLRISR
ncbi:Rieske 2Fe-2S domain-containing protein [Tenacibaculum piscium]|uniref:Rieske domain-containing protein n=1 Tax=Tenacibaculum piscium TaxID=1458515 RepID=A0A2H1YKJ8_9FLAO|nr:Rieske 2Fe-2S domain-containing protein [Tenacibaculum piscium]MBE7628518.1 Rieske 2Fe-2S domain-containing protein [Tenacibaculum piscium]MBE7669658.1 Rieske 2Fe-2S domain-containing protein [Tenacibaculum piscium]MBE7689373.1 Rieske 2Fe-2S domain-containing protein [Tenacibaculum piscium]MCG8182733.1 Rieske 2Fe-2S domain-containing protein [Tenacibaculum piscium]MCG8204125.1 Rieske 2Fe-2S domain-containing protein [Tenacibaculum piscium]